MWINNPLEGFITGALHDEKMMQWRDGYLEISREGAKITVLQQKSSSEMFQSKVQNIRNYRIF